EHTTQQLAPKSLLVQIMRARDKGSGGANSASIASQRGNAMFNPTSRRGFLQAGGVGALAAATDLSFISKLRPVSAAEAQIDPKIVQFGPDIEPIVRLLEDTPRERVLEEFAARIKGGLSYREVL